MCWGSSGTPICTLSVVSAFVYAGCVCLLCVYVSLLWTLCFVILKLCLLVSVAEIYEHRFLMFCVLAVCLFYLCVLCSECCTICVCLRVAGLFFFLRGCTVLGLPACYFTSCVVFVSAVIACSWINCTEAACHTATATRALTYMYVTTIRVGGRCLSVCVSSLYSLCVRRVCVQWVWL